MTPILKLRYLAAAPFVLVGMALVAISMAYEPAKVYALTNCTVADLTLDSEEVAFATLINDYRQANGAPKLTVSVNLNRMASWHAKDMADKNYFSHTDSLGRSPSTRGSQCEARSGIGENIAAGTSWDTAQEAFDAWKGSSGHNQNMLNSGYQQIGIARYYNANSTYKWYWVTDFSLNSDGTDMLGGGGTTPSTATATPTRTATPQPAATSTPTRTATPTATRTATPTSQRGGPPNRNVATSTPAVATSTSTRTPTPAAATSTPTSAYMHVGDLDGAGTTGQSGWTATVQILVVNASGNPVAGATVNAAWAKGGSGSASCVTASTGRCSVVRTGIGAPSITLTVSSVTHASLKYDSNANNDPESDSNGTTIVVSRP